MVNSSGLKKPFLSKIDWVSSDSVGFPAFSFAVCVTNFVAAGFHLKNRSQTNISFNRQLQTSWLDTFRQFVWFVRSYKLYVSIVGWGFTSNDASKENNRINLRNRSGWRWSWGGGGGNPIKMLGWGADKNAMSNLIFSAPTFYFAPPPLQRKRVGFWVTGDRDRVQ